MKQEEQDDIDESTYKALHKDDIDESTYKALHKVGSALRTELTKDLLSRRAAPRI